MRLTDISSTLRIILEIKIAIVKGTRRFKMKYILVRHGETLQNVGQGATELDPCAALSPKGLNQTEQAVKKISAILLEKNIRASLYYSPYRRTKHMAELLQREVQFFSVREEPLLSEIQCGSFSGYTMKNYGVDHPDEYKKFVRYRNEKCRFYYRFPDGESPFDVYVRICLFLALFQLNKKLVIPLNWYVIIYQIWILFDRSQLVL